MCAAKRSGVYDLMCSFDGGERCPWIPCILLLYTSSMPEHVHLDTRRTASHSINGFVPLSPACPRALPFRVPCPANRTEKSDECVHGIHTRTSTKPPKSVPPHSCVSPVTIVEAEAMQYTHNPCGSGTSSIELLMDALPGANVPSHLSMGKCMAP